MEAETRTSGRRERARTTAMWAIGGASVLAIAAVVTALYFRRGASGEAGEGRQGAQDPLPYVNYAPVPKEHRGKSGTTTYKKDRASPGYNLYVQKPDTGAILVDMQGEIVHRWSSEEGQPARPLERWRGWRTVHMTPNGELYAASEHISLIKLDWDSHLLWKADVAAHHEVVIDEAGLVYTLASERRVAPVGDKDRFVEDDVITVVAPEDGKVKRRISIFDVFDGDEALKKILTAAVNKRYAKLDAKGLSGLVRKKQRGVLANLETLMRTGNVEGMDLYEQWKLTRSIPGAPCDVFHANTIVLLKDHASGLWKNGDIMVSLRHLNLLVAFDPESKKVKWTWGPGEVYGQHEPSILPNGNVLVYDNGTWRPGTRGAKGSGGEGKYSRILEVDPVTKKIVWSYEGTPRSSFYSPAEGGAQLLPNGNILAAEEGGRAFEITRDKEIVWEYFNPKFDKSGKGRSGMYRIERLPAAIAEPLLSRPKPAAN